MATHSSILLWWIPWTEEPGSLQSIGFHRVRHNWSYLMQSTVVFRPKSLKSVLILNSKWFTCYMRKSLSHVWLFMTPWAVQSMEFFQARILEWVTVPFSRKSSQPRDWTQVSRIAGGFFTIWATREALWTQCLAHISYPSLGEWLFLSSCSFSGWKLKKTTGQDRMWLLSNLL